MVRCNSQPCRRLVEWLVMDQDPRRGTLNYLSCGEHLAATLASLMRQGDVCSFKRVTPDDVRHLPIGMP